MAADAAVPMIAAYIPVLAIAVAPASHRLGPGGGLGPGPGGGLGPGGPPALRCSHALPAESTPLPTPTASYAARAD